MRTIDIFVYPYQRSQNCLTALFIDGQEINSPNNRMTKFVVNRPMERWLTPYQRKLFVWNGFLPELVTDLNDSEYTVRFHGRAVEFKSFSQAMEAQKVTLEKSGRAVALTIEFHETLRIEKAREALTEAFDDLSFKAYRGNQFDLVTTCAAVKETLNSVPLCIIGQADDAQKAALDEDALLVLREKHPKVVLGLIQNSAAVVSVRKKAVALMQGNDTPALCVLMIAETLIDTPTEQVNQVETVDPKIRICSFRTENLISQLHDTLYAYYFPAVMTEALTQFDRIFQTFDDRDTDAYLIHAAESAEKLFKKED